MRHCLNNAYILINLSQKQIDHNKYFLGALFSSLVVTFRIGLQLNNTTRQQSAFTHQGHMQIFWQINQNRPCISTGVKKKRKLSIVKREFAGLTMG